MAGDETKTKHLVRGSLILGVLALRNGCRGRNLQVPCSKCALGPATGRGNTARGAGQPNSALSCSSA